MASLTFKIAFDYDATALSSVKEFHVYTLVNGARSGSPVITPTVPTDTNPLVLNGVFGQNKVEIVPVDQSGAESSNTAFFTATLQLPAPTNVRQIQ